MICIQIFTTMQQKTQLGLLTRQFLALVQKAVYVYCRPLKLENEAVNLTNQWVGLCFCDYVYKVCCPPSLILELSG